MFYRREPHWTVAGANLCGDGDGDAAGLAVLWERDHEIPFSLELNLLMPGNCCAVQFLSKVA